MEPESFWSILDEDDGLISSRTEKVRIYLPDGEYMELAVENISNVDDDTAELTPPGKLIYVDVRSVTHIDFIEYKEEAATE